MISWPLCVDGQKSFCSVADASVATLQEMNPLVKVSVQQGTLDTIELDFVQAYQVSALAECQALLHCSLHLKVQA